jgi:DNA-binding transcriptional LysR family regulator
VSLDLGDIEAFLAVAEERNFTRAAARLHTTQQQLSAQIKRFERQLGVDLFLRTTRKLELTGAGTTLLTGASDVLDHASQWLSRARRLSSGNSGTVIIGYTQTCGYETLPALAAAVQSEFPDIVLVTRELYAADIEDQVGDHTLDLGLLRCPVGRPGTIHELLTHEPLMLAVAATHPLGRRRTVSLKEATSNELAMWPRDLIPGYFDTCAAAWIAAGGQPTHISTASTGSALWAKIAAGHSVGLVVSSFELACPPGIRLLNVREHSDVGVSVTWPTANRSPAVERILALARERMRE